MQTRAGAQEACARHCMILKLRQCLPAEARAAGAEEHNVSRTSRAETPRRILDRDQVVVLGGKPQQRQAAVGMARTQPSKRRLGPPKHLGERRRRYAVWSDFVGKRKIDRLLEAHGADYCIFEVTPCGRPTTVTSMPPSSRRLAMRLVSSSVTASIKADRLSM